MKHYKPSVATTFLVALCLTESQRHSTYAFVLPTREGRTTSSLLRATWDNTDKNSKDNFVVGVLGDLHMDPRKLEDYDEGREHWSRIFQKSSTKNAALVSLGDLGESKAVWPDSDELFSGTTACHEMVAEYLNSFGVPYEVVGGNHDLEGIDEFATDKENLDMLLRVHGKPTPQFYRQIAPKTILVGLTSTVFRDAKWTSHEVTIDAEQLKWFEETLERHPASDGWKVFVFTHAPPAGSGLKVLAENHVVNGCCWLNQSNEDECRKYIELVRKHRCIKAWFSGHFHLGQNYQNSITFPNTASDDEDDELSADRGSCVFCQTSVMRSGTSRDGHCQSRLIRGNPEGFEICTVDHQKNGKIRVDARVTYTDCENEVGAYVMDEDEEHQFEQLFQPVHDEHDSIHLPEGGLVEYDDYLLLDKDVSKDTSSWFYLKCGRVLGMYKGMLLEYDPMTLAPLGLVVSADELVGKRVAVIDADPSSDEEDSIERANDSSSIQAIVLIDECDDNVVVVQPNEDGSYWRKIVRNKMVRMLEMRREKAAKKFAKEILDNQDPRVVSSWGPYKQTSGVAKSTGESDLLSVSMASEDDGRDETSNMDKQKESLEEVLRKASLVVPRVVSTQGKTIPSALESKGP
mmetsp:Transcript_2771/g.5386  ORF Transcript_2771/g.5386 Transcript_2771/m.5386 type:complete len:631 (-) Transcript_2771:73-1965(-)